MKRPSPDRLGLIRLDFYLIHIQTRAFNSARHRRACSFHPDSGGFDWCHSREWFRPGPRSYRFGL